MRPFIKTGAIAGLSSVILVMLFGRPRILYRMAEVLPPGLARIHPRYQTPYIGSLLTDSCTAAAAGIFPMGILGELASTGTLLAFTFDSWEWDNSRTGTGRVKREKSGQSLSNVAT